MFAQMTITTAEAIQLLDWFLDLKSTLGRISKQMADITQELADIKADLDSANAALATVGSGVTGLQSQVATLTQTVADLKAQLATAGLTAEQQAALDALVAQADGVRVATEGLAGQFAPAEPPPPPPPAPPQ